MKRRLPNRIAIIIRGLCAMAASLAAAGVLPAVDERLNNSIGAHIEFLASDLLEGRGTGTIGHEIAARYVAAQLRQMGLVPGGNSNTWFQTVPLVESRPVPNGSRLELHFEGQDQRFEAGIDFLARPRFLETNTTVTAPLVFAGFGVKAPELGYDDFEGLDLSGKIAVVLFKAPPRFPATALAHYGDSRQKVRALVERGAIGYIVIPRPKDLEEFPWPGLVTQFQFATMAWVHADGRLSEVYPRSKATVVVSPRGAGKLFARAPQRLEEVLAAADRSQPPRFPLDLEATISQQSEHRNLTSPNVVGILPGVDPRLSGESILLTAHLDHLGRASANQGDTIYNGAYDNAIGVAMMLEVGRLLATEGSRPRRTVVLAAVTAEEKGHGGSEFLAEHLPPEAGRPVANLNLDMVLVTAPTRRFTIIGVEHSTLRTPVEAAAQMAGLELMSDPHPERVQLVRSDQYSFIRRGVPAIWPIVAETGEDPAVQTGLSPGVFRKEHYHRPSDDLSLPRDGESTVRFVRFMVELVRRIADAEESPRWNPGDFFGETFGRKTQPR